jgi:GT2 family glycosyltransferase
VPVPVFGTLPRVPPRLTAIVVHYGDPAPTRRCLDSLAGIDEIVLVDQPPTRFGEHAAVTTRIETPRNVGFAAACNLAVARAGAPFVLLINNDAVLAPEAAPTLLAGLETPEPDVAGACLKLLAADGKTFQSAGGLWFTRDGIGFPRAFGETDRGQYDRLGDDEIGVPSGAAAIYRTSAWHEVGGMPEEFFCYCEDGDIGLAMIAAGYRFVWLPAVCVRHELSASTADHSAFKAFHVERNHFAVALRNAPASTLAALPLFTSLRLLRTLVDAFSGRGAGGGLAAQSSPATLATALVRAWVEALAMAPRSLARRRALSQRFPEGTVRVSRFLGARRVALSDFTRSRSVAGKQDR